jgi:predicted metal-binding membrane protein
LTRDRLIVVFALLIVVGLAWAYLWSGAGMSMMMPAVWTPDYAVLMFFMWWIMMVAMMLPSATPMILVFARANHQQLETGRARVATSIFVLGYLATWAAFSLVATLAQWALEGKGLLTPSLVSNSALLSAGILLAAGFYQLTPIKRACLRHCRSPLAFISTHWRQGALGALRMGVVHGAYCVGCCWFLMGLLFFGGVMNLYWIAGIALFVLLEKTVPAGHWFDYATGVALLLWGAGILLFSS